MANTQDLLSALEAILAGDGKGFFVLKDFAGAADGRPEIVRRLRDHLPRAEGQGRHVFLVVATARDPRRRKKEIYVIEYELPDELEIARMLETEPEEDCSGTEGLSGA